MRSCLALILSLLVVLIGGAVLILFISAAALVGGKSTGDIMAAIDSIDLRVVLAFLVLIGLAILWEHK